MKQQPPTPTGSTGPQLLLRYALVIVLVLVAQYFVISIFSGPESVQLPYSEFKQLVRKGKIAKVTFQGQDMNGTFSTPVPIYSRIFPNSLWYFSVEDINIEKDSSVSCVFVGYSIGYKPTIYYAWIKNGNLLNVVDLDNVINFRSFFQYSDYMIPFARIVTDSTKLYIAFQIQRPGSDWTIYLSCIDRQSLYTNQRNTYYSYPRRNFMAYSNHKGEIVLSLQKDMLVIVSLYDIQGERIATISNSVLRSGKHYLALNREKICSGMYIVKVSTRDGDIMLREKIIK